MTIPFLKEKKKKKKENDAFLYLYIYKKVPVLDACDHFNFPYK